MKPNIETGEIALPAVCGQTGKPLLMVVRPHGRTVLELIRAVAIAARSSVSGLPVSRSDQPHPTHDRVPNRGAFNRAEGKEISEGKRFQQLKVRAKVDFSDFYEGCPYCGALGFFHCSSCGLFSCWTSHNQRTHFDHSDIWCEGCRRWRCSSRKDDDDSLTEVMGYAASEGAVDQRSHIEPGSTRRDRIDRLTTVRGYLD